MRDTVLSIDIGQDDCLYRILRSRSDNSPGSGIASEPSHDGLEESSKNNHNNDNDNDNDNEGDKDDGTDVPGHRVVYVDLRYLELIPEPSRTRGPDVIRILSQLASWPLAWKTLTIRAPSSAGDPPRCDADEFAPHALSPRELFGDYPFFDILQLVLVPAAAKAEGPDPDPSTSSPAAPRRRHKQAHRSFRVAPGRFLKVARFAFELPWLAHEIHAHHILAHRDRGMASLAPRILGYAYEETPDRVVGLLTEELAGARPRPRDLPACRAALRRLHALDILHGDVARDNMFVTADAGRVKFIDWEEACVGPLGDEADWEARKSEEMASLAEKLMVADDDDEEEEEEEDEDEEEDDDDDHDDD